MDNNRHVVAVFAAALLLVSCSQKIVERAVVQHDTTEVRSRDSLFFRDSIYIKEWVKGDTIYIDRFRDRYVYRDRWRDSISIKEVHDTTLVEKKVEKELTAGQKAKMGAFWWLVLAVAGFAGWTFRKPILNLVRRII